MYVQNVLVAMDVQQSIATVTAIQNKLMRIVLCALGWDGSSTCHK